jgi:diguanylate cyclase (GGDEF)-like protein
LNAPVRDNDRNLYARMADMAAQLAALRTIVDDLSIGIVLLDRDRRVQFINRAFRRFWRISDTVADTKQTFVALLYEGRGSTASTASHYLLGDYVAKKMDLIHAGEEDALHIRLSNGEVIQFRCKALADGGRLLTYGNVSELAHRADALERLACVDGMTGVNNRRHFRALADSEWSRHQRYGRPLAVLMIDIDCFKAVNDTYGHDAGDEVIKGVAGVLQRNKRAHDILGRLGGEEFALLLIEANVDNAVAAAERLRRLVADCVITVHKHRIPVTVSVGLSVCHAEAGGIDELLKQADIALYEAKRTGRNRVCQFDHCSTPASPPNQLP